MSFKLDSWSKAEKAVFAELCKLTKTKPTESAFLGYMPPIANVWALDTGKIPQADSVWCPAVTSLWLQAEIEGQYAEREKAQSMMMQIVRLGELRIGSTLFRVRQGGDFSVILEAVTLANQESVAPLWVFKIGCEIVFSTADDTTPEVEPAT